MMIIILIISIILINEGIHKKKNMVKQIGLIGVLIVLMGCLCMCGIVGTCEDNYIEIEE